MVGGVHGESKVDQPVRGHASWWYGRSNQRDITADSDRHESRRGGTDNSGPAATRTRALPNLRGHRRASPDGSNMLRSDFLNHVPRFDSWRGYASTNGRAMGRDVGGDAAGAARCVWDMSTPVVSIRPLTDLLGPQCRINEVFSKNVPGSPAAMLSSSGTDAVRGRDASRLRTVDRRRGRSWRAGFPERRVPVYRRA